ncbi:MAG: hypothetical protein QM478_12095 [Flavobacteriaceae bacterium]
MRTKKSLLTAMLAIALLFSYATFAQEEEKESYGMAEIIYIDVKVGMEKAFVSAVKEHNAMYHKEGPYAAGMDVILSGKEAGWYVWYMGPCTFTDLDNAPGDGAHADHWRDNVAPNIESYGRQEYWRINDKLSYQSSTDDMGYSTIWFIDIKRGDYYRFKSIMGKIHDAYEKRGDGSMRVYNNQFNDSEGRDIAIVWDMKNLAEMDDDDESIKKEYEEINGEGSWNNMIDEWEEITVSINSQLWENNITK